MSGLGPGGTAMLAGLTGKHIAIRGPARGGPALGLQAVRFAPYFDFGAVVAPAGTFLALALPAAVG